MEKGRNVDGIGLIELNEKQTEPHTSPVCSLLLLEAYSAVKQKQTIPDKVGV